MFLPQMDCNYINARDAERIIVRTNKRGDDMTFAILRNGEEVRLETQAEDIIADMGRVIPAHPGFSFATIDVLSKEEVKFTFELAHIVAWRIEQTVAVPVLPGEFVDLDRQCAIIGPDGHCVEFRPRDWGRLNPWRGTFAAWITRAGAIIARDRQDAARKLSSAKGA